MATSSERSPPPFPDSEDQDVLDTEEVGGRDSHSDEDDGDDLFMSTSNPPLTGMDSILSPTIEPSNVLMKPPVDLMADPLFEPVSIQTANTPSSKVEPSDDFVDLTNNITDSPDEEDAAESPVADAEEDKTEIPLDEPAEEFEDIFGSETEAPQEEVVEADVTVEETPTDKVEEASSVTVPPVDGKTGSDEEEEAIETSTDPIIDLGADLPAVETEQPPPASQAFVDPLEDLLSDVSPAAETQQPPPANVTFADPLVDVIIDDSTAAETQEPPRASEAFFDPLEDLLSAVSPATETQEPPRASEAFFDPLEDLGAVLPATETQQPPPASNTFVDPLDDFLSDDSPASETQQPPPASKTFSDPLVDLLSAAASAAEAKIATPATVDLFEDEGSDFFTEARQTKPAKQQKSLFGEADEDLFGESLGATSKKAVSTEPKDKPVKTKAASTDVSNMGGPLQDSTPAEPADLFSEEAVATVPIVKNTSAASSKTNGVHSEEEMDIFAEATVELSLDSPRVERKKDVTVAPSTSAAPPLSAAASLVKPQAAALEEILVSVKDPEKVGDGMNAYMGYKVTTQTQMPMFRNKTFTVRRRFSDFLGLYEKLSEKHGPNGFIVPPPPEKSILGMTKVKVGKDDSSAADFVERRRAALERYLQRVVNHPSLLQDPDVREFLERDELPRATSTQALSGAGFLKMINKATDAVSKMTIKMNESDVWFEEKLQEVESSDQHFRKLHALVESLVVHRKELSLNTAGFAKSTAMLGSAEDNTALSRALSQLAEVEDKMEQLHQDQAANDTFSFAELIADYIRLLGAVRAWQRWQDAQTVLQKKRETEAKLLWANKPDKLQLAKEEIAEWEAKVTQYERDFERVSATVRKEVVRFEKEKARNCKREIINYLECLLQSQQQLIKYWEAFLPEAKAIA
ncbi:Sorting nexin-1 [Dissostichus eleginoides]|uniref:Sorting nexin-1 n=1 Tax=Dissostichus eleginoides TaxID=100907 RepID=A0AAD9BTB2_DISEL|nr:Sorting nexin-1 [Dissostichus eleginoides]